MRELRKMIKRGRQERVRLWGDSGKEWRGV